MQSELSTSQVAPLAPHVVSKIKTFCGDCHAMPDPQTFPKSRWEEEVVQGYQFYIDSGRSDLPEPIRSETVRYFRDHAPDEVTIPTVASEPSTHLFPASQTSTGMDPRGLS